MPIVILSIERCLWMGGRESHAPRVQTCCWRRVCQEEIQKCREENVAAQGEFRIIA